MQATNVTLLPRETTGSRPARRLREKNIIPAVIYGKGFESKPVSVSSKVIRDILLSETGINSLITVEFEGKKLLCLLRGLQKDPIKRIINHVDFLVVDPEKPVSFEVPIVLKNDPVELFKLGGRVEQLVFKLTVKAKPSNIPTSLELDISGLTLGGSLKVSDIKLPENVSTDVDPEVIVVVGQASRLSRLRSAQGESSETEQQS